MRGNMLHVKADNDRNTHTQSMQTYVSHRNIRKQNNALKRNKQIHKYSSYCTRTCALKEGHWMDCCCDGVE